jgi:hypothetical protein
MVAQLPGFVMHDERRIREAHVDALRAVLEVPAAGAVGVIVACNELAQGRIGNAFAFDQPVAAIARATAASMASYATASESIGCG